MNNSSELGRVSQDAVYTLKARLALFFAGLMEQSLMQGDANGEYKIARINNIHLEILPYLSCNRAYLG